MSAPRRTDPGRIVVVGASLAGINAAEELRRCGYTGRLTLVGAEPHLPYDRPPLSKVVASGRMEPRHEQLPSRSTWRSTGGWARLPRAWTAAPGPCCSTTAAPFPTTGC